LGFPEIYIAASAGVFSGLFDDPSLVVRRRIPRQLATAPFVIKLDVVFDLDGLAQALRRAGRMRICPAKVAQTLVAYACTAAEDRIPKPNRAMHERTIRQYHFAKCIHRTRKA